MAKYVYSFGNGTADGDGKMKDTLGGKGAGLAEMCRAKLPVPPGFTISTQVCNIYFDNNFSVPAEIDEQMLAALKTLESRMGQKLGADDLLVPRPRRLDTLAAAFGDERIVAFQEFLDLHRIVGERFRSRVDGRQSSADHDHRHPQLHVRNRVCFGGAG